MAHYLSNRGKLKLVEGSWNDAGAGVIRVGLCQGASVPVAVDTQAEIDTINLVSEFIALVTEATFTNYARQNLTRTNAAEDDANDRINLDASDIVINNAGGAVNNTLWGGFVYEFVTNDADSHFLSMFTFASTITTNGSNLTLAIADLYRIS